MEGRHLARGARLALRDRIPAILRFEERAVRVEES